MVALQCSTIAAPIIVSCNFKFLVFLHEFCTQVSEEGCSNVPIPGEGERHIDTRTSTRSRPVNSVMIHRAKT